MANPNIYTEKQFFALLKKRGLNTHSIPKAEIEEVAAILKTRFDSVSRRMKSTFGFVYNQKTQTFSQSTAALPKVQKAKKPVAQVKKQLERTIAKTPDLPTKKTSATVKTERAVEQNLVPIKDAEYVPFGNFKDVKKVLASKQFYPMFITGLSGNGKTYSVEQACAQLNRCLLYTSPSPRDRTRSRMPSSA